VTRDKHKVMFACT